MAAICVLVVVLRGGSGYTIHALFEDSGQLVSGGEVQVAGRPVGQIAGLSLTPGGLADVTLSISDGSVTPLHRGTRAIIRAVGQAGVNNRFVQLIPGADRAPTLPSGSVLPTTQTTGIVDLDAVLDTFDPGTRASLENVFAHSSQVFAGSGARYFNRMLQRLDPALTAFDGLTGQVSGDDAELSQLVRSGALTAHAIATRSTDLQQAVANASVTFGEVASQRAALADLLHRAPGVLTSGGQTLSNASTAITVLRPVLRELVPLAPPLERLLSQVAPTLRELTSTVGRLNGELTPLARTLAGLKPLAGPAIAALRSSATALTAAMPILVGLREYGSDLVLGIFNGLGGLVSGPYTSQGHYAKLNFVQSLQTLFAGIGSQYFSSAPIIPGVLGVRTHVLARCPGGDAPPAPDGSSPWIPDRSLCNPADDTPLSVDFP